MKKPPKALPHPPLFKPAQTPSTPPTLAPSHYCHNSFNHFIDSPPSHYHPPNSQHTTCNIFDVFL